MPAPWSSRAWSAEKGREGTTGMPALVGTAAITDAATHGAGQVPRLGCNGAETRLGAPPGDGGMGGESVSASVERRQPLGLEANEGDDMRAAMAGEREGQGTTTGTLARVVE